MGGRDRSLRIIPASEWRRVGCNEVASDIMQQLQIDMKHLHQEEGWIQLVPRTNKGRLESIHVQTYTCPEGYCMRHHDWMLAHWEAFARALTQQQGVKIHIMSFQLPPPVLEKLLPSMQHMERISLCECDLRSAGLCCLSSFLRQNSSLLSLHVSGTRMTDHNAVGSFSEALSSHPTLRKLSIGGFQLPPPVLEKLLPSMQNMERISLCDCDLGSAGFRCFSSFLRQNSSLLTLQIRRTRVRDLNAVGSFSEALSSHPTLRKLRLIDCHLNRTLHRRRRKRTALRRILGGCERIESLDFRENHIGSSGAAAIAGFISRNETQTKRITLSWLYDADAGVQQLMESLRKNTALERLNMGLNQLTDKGKQKMMKAVLDTTDVTSIVLSNHTCHLRVRTDDPVDFGEEATMMRINASAELSTDQRIRKKVVFALCDKPWILTSLLQYFDDSPLELVPCVLKLIQEQHAYQSRQVDIGKSETDSLSRLFLGLKIWRMRMLILFESAHPPLKRARRTRKRKVDCFH